MPDLSTGHGVPMGFLIDREGAFVVNALIDHPPAHQTDPRTMGNLRTIRTQHRDAGRT